MKTIFMVIYILSFLYGDVLSAEQKNIMMDDIHISGIFKHFARLNIEGSQVDLPYHGASYMKLFLMSSQTCCKINIRLALFHYRLIHLA